MMAQEWWKLVRLLTLSFFTLSLFAQTWQGTGITLLPPVGGGTGSITFRELKANGTNYLNLFAPNSIAATFTMTLPNTPSAGPTGTYWNLCADDTMILTWCSTTGAGSFIDTTTNQAGLGGDKTTGGVWTFLNVINTYNVIPDANNTRDVGSSSKFYANNYTTNVYAGSQLVVGGVSSDAILTSTALNLYGLLSSTPVADTIQIGGFDGVGPVVSYSGRFKLFKQDGVSLKAGISHLDNSLWESVNGYTVNGVTVIDGFRDATFNNLNFTTCGNCVTLTGSQVSGFTGNKRPSGVWQFANTVTVDNNILETRGNSFLKYFEVDPTLPLVTIYRPVSSGAGNAARVQFRTFSGLGVDDGVIQTLSGVAGFETAVNVISSTAGIYTSVGFNANGSYGLSISCAVGQTVRQPQYIFGLLVSGICQI